MPRFPLKPNVEWLYPIGPLAAEAGATTSHEDKKAYFLEGLKKRFGDSRPSKAGLEAAAVWMDLLFASSAPESIPQDILEGPCRTIARKVAKWAKDCDQPVYHDSTVPRDGCVRMRWEVPKAIVNGIIRQDKAHMRRVASPPAGDYDA